MNRGREILIARAISYNMNSIRARDISVPDADRTRETRDKLSDRKAPKGRDCYV